MSDPYLLNSGGGAFMAQRTPPQPPASGPNASVPASSGTFDVNNPESPEEQKVEPSPLYEFLAEEGGIVVAYMKESVEMQEVLNVARLFGYTKFKLHPFDEKRFLENGGQGNPAYDETVQLLPSDFPLQISGAYVMVRTE